jgi:serine phosphatase RsbU (regulator of sigma subunit)/anti-sigma regulatory factor (Ser/Thr protein kinase)
LSARRRLPADPLEGLARVPLPDEDPMEQLRRLQRVTDATLGHLSIEELMDELLERVREVLEADTAAVLLLDAEANELVARAAKGLEEEVERGVRIPLGKGFAGKIAAELRPVAIEQVSHANVLNPILREKGVRSMLGVPLIVQGNLIGVLHVGTLVRRVFSPADTQLLQLVADRLALALHVRLYERERFVADTLQRSLLPDSIPMIPGLRLSTRYLPGVGDIHVGGDWYDAFGLARGALAVAIGDVAGRGLRAATMMGRIRTALRAYAVLDPSPGAVVGRLDRLVAHFDPGELATLIYATIDPDLSSMRMVVAGHVPPIRIGQGRADLVETAGGHDPPLGSDLHMAFREHVVPLEPGSTLMLYTDGLIERRGESLTAGLERLRQAAGAIKDPLDVGEVADELLRAMLPEERAPDDVAILMLGRELAGQPRLELSVRARARELAVVRRALRRWMNENRMAPEVAQDVLTAVGEAVANSIEHAYGANQGWVTLEAVYEADRLEIIVRDTGAWRPPRSGDRGRGIPLMRAIMDTVEVDHAAVGTTVRMDRRVSSE